MKYKSYCRCGQPFVPDSRHVGESGLVEDCRPADNLEYLEFKLEKRERQEKAERSKRIL